MVCTVHSLRGSNGVGTQRIESLAQTHGPIGHRAAEVGRVRHAVGDFQLVEIVSDRAVDDATEQQPAGTVVQIQSSVMRPDSVV